MAGWQITMKRRRMNRRNKIFTGILTGCMLTGTMALANGQAAILETVTGESEISVYIENAEADASNITVQIATSEMDGIRMQPVSELDTPMKTLVVIDNSLSIAKDDRSKIAELLQNLIADRLDSEEICIAVFSEEINKLTDYTSDYGTLKKAVDGIAYQDQETYLTDVLYDLLSAEYGNGAEDVYRRIIVISDGVDNKAFGYTKEELYTLLKNIQIPIYTVGSSNGKNNEELESMFAISRMTCADYFLLRETEDLLDITNELNQDRNIIKLTITPPEEMLDGSRKTVKITCSDQTVLTAEIVMPQQAYVKETEELPLPVQEETDRIAVPVAEEETEDGAVFPLPVVLVSAAVIGAALAITIIIFIIRKKKKNNQPEFELLDTEILGHAGQRAGSPEERTELVDSGRNQEDDGSTVMIWNQGRAYQAVLTDIHSPSKSFQVPLNQSIVIGRKSGECDIVLDYEKSVSGKHCEIGVRDGKFYVKDMQSSNHTYLNGNKVLVETEIYSGNILKLGRLEMRFEVR